VQVAGAATALDYRLQSDPTGLFSSRLFSSLTTPVYISLLCGKRQTVLDNSFSLIVRVAEKCQAL
jgi:hypothetical protein